MPPSSSNLEEITIKGKFLINIIENICVKIRQESISPCHETNRFLCHETNFLCHENLFHDTKNLFHDTKNGLFHDTGK